MDRPIETSQIIAGRRINIAGVTYLQIVVDTPATMRAAGLNNVADLMEQNKVTHQIGMRRPKGRKCYVAQRFDDGSARVVCSV